MAEAEIRVVARAVGFEEVSAKAQRAADALRRMGEMTVKAGGTNSGPWGQTARQIDDATRRMQQFRREQERMWNGRSMGAIMGAQWRREMEAAMAKPLPVPPALFSSVRTQFAAAINSGWQQAGATLKNDPFAALAVGAVARVAARKVLNPASDREQVRLNLLGTGLVSPGQARSLEVFARGLSRTTGNISTTESLGFLKDVLQITGNPDHVFASATSSKLTPDAVKGLTSLSSTLSYLKTYNAGQHAGSAGELFTEAANAIRSAEIAGKGTHIEDIAKWTDQLLKVQLATGVKPTDYLAAQRIAGASFLTATDKFRFGYFPAYIQEQGVSAGTQLSTSFSHMVGGIGQRGDSTLMLDELGLISHADRKKLKFSNSGELLKMRDMSALKGSELAARDRFTWTTTVLWDAIKGKLVKEGYDPDATGGEAKEKSTVRLIQILSQIFGNQREARMAAEYLVQQQNFEKRAQNVEKVNVDKAARIGSYVGMMQTFQAQMEEFQVNLGQVVMPLVTTIMPGVNGILSGVGDGVKWASDTLGPAGGFAAAGAAAYVGGGLLLKGLYASPLLRTIALLTAGATTGGGILPYLIAGSMLRNGGGMIASAGRAATSIAGGVEGAAVGAAIGRATAKGFLGRMVAGLPIWLAAGAASTESGQSALGYFWKSAKLAYHKLKGTGTPEEEKQRDAAYVDARKKMRAAARGMGIELEYDPEVDDPEFAPKTKAERKAYYDKRAKSIPLPTRRPRPSELLPSLSLLSSDLLMPKPSPTFRNSSRFSNGSGPRGGPVPVVVQSMPKGQDRPNNIVVNNTINVTASGLGAIGAAIAGAVGPATAASVNNALSDIHH